MCVIWAVEFDGRWTRIQHGILYLPSKTAVAGITVRIPLQNFVKLTSQSRSFSRTTVSTLTMTGLPTFVDALLVVGSTPVSIRCGLL